MNIGSLSFSESVSLEVLQLKDLTTRIRLNRKFLLKPNLRNNLEIKNPFLFDSLVKTER